MSVFPDFVRSLEDAIDYLRSWLDGLPASAVEYDQTVLATRDTLHLVLGPVPVLFLRRTVAHLPNGLRLAIRRVVDADLRPLYYSFEMIDASNRRVWAYHYDTTHEHEDGTRSHRNDRRGRRPCPPVELEPLLDEILKTVARAGA